MAGVGWWQRRRARAAAGKQQARDESAAAAHLARFVASRRGVEGFVEQPTSFNKPSLLLVAHDGEWTRRSVPSPRWAHTFCTEHHIPGYDAGVVGYPQRMRDYNARQKRHPS